jgi:hypothetical protein
MISCDACGKPIDTSKGYYTAGITMVEAGETPITYQFHKQCMVDIVSTPKA